MPVNYKVSGDVDITPAIGPGRHDWSMLQNEIMQGRTYKARKAAEEQAAKEAKAKQAADEAKYNPQAVEDYDYNNVIFKKGREVLDYSAQSYKMGSTGSAEHNYNIGKKRQETGLLAGKAKAAIATYKEAYQNVDQLPSYVLKNQLNTKILEASKPTYKDSFSKKMFNVPFNKLNPDQQRSVVSSIPKDVNANEIDLDAIDPKEIAGIASNYYGDINTADMYVDKVKGLGQKVHSTENMFGVSDPNDGTALGQMIRSDTTKAKFFKPVLDKKGNVTRWSPGVTDEAAGFMLDNDAEVQGEAQARLQEYYEKETAARVSAGDKRDIREIYQDVQRNIDGRKFMRDHVKLNLERLNEVSTDTGLKQGYKYDKSSGTDEDFSATKMVNQKRNINLRREGSETDDIRVGDVPEEYRFSGKKLDQPVLVNSTKIYDENKNTAISGQESVGDKKFYPTRTMLMGYNTKTGKYIHGQTEAVKKNPDIVFKWVVGGTIDATEKDGKGEEVKIKKNVFMPYDEVSNDMKAKYGFDLNDRNPEEISDLELTSIIKQQYPDASAQEKIKIFNRFRGR